MYAEQERVCLIQYDSFHTGVPQQGPLFRLAAASAAFLMVFAGASCILAQTTTANFRRHPVSLAKPLTVYFVDVEGGQSTLFVTPSHQSLLVDTGWPGNDGRDADRIMKVVETSRARPHRLPADHAFS